MAAVAVAQRGRVDPHEPFADHEERATERGPSGPVVGLDPGDAREERHRAAAEHGEQPALQAVAVPTGAERGGVDPEVYGDEGGDHALLDVGGLEEVQDGRRAEHDHGGGPRQSLTLAHAA
jgi:hypothetical protein